MGWKGYEAEIPIGMIFKKMYCCVCASRLKKHKVSNTFKKGEDGYQNHILGHATIGMDKIEKGYFIYKCPNCGNMLTYENQLEISKIQRRLGKKILSSDERRIIGNTWFW